MTTGHNIAMGLRVSYLLMHRQTNAFLAPYEITADQFVLLFLLAQQDGITQKELSRRAASDPNTIRAMLVLLENKGLISRQQHPKDGRALKVILTPQGRQMYTQITETIIPLQEALADPFQPREVNNLIGYLNRIADAMASWEHGNRPVKTQ